MPRTDGAAGGRRPVLPSRRLHTVLLRDGAALNVVEYGPANADVTVVLAHGWTLTHGSWAVPAQALADAGVRVVTYDQRGHGRSTAGLERPFSVDRLGEDLAELIEATVPTGPIVLGGHSMGGMTIMALAAARPELFETGDRVRGVLLCATSAGDLVPVAPHFRWGARLRSRAMLRFFAWGEQRPQAFARGRKLLPGPQTKAHVRATRRGLFGKNADDAVVQSCAWMVYNTPVDALCGFFPALAAHDKAGRLGALASVPVRIVVGDRDKLTPVGHSKRLAAELAHAELDIEPGCGHMVLTERPETVAAPLRDLCRAAAGPESPAPVPEPASAG
ncbi:alpha/beta fold hydrolase [Yinghuangia aomiensis]